MKIILKLFFIIYFVKVVFLTKYILKNKPKIPQLGEWAVPQVPQMAYDIYPGIEWHTLDQKYMESKWGEDLAQIETVVGIALPKNVALIGKATAAITLNANKIKKRYLTE